MQRFQNTLGNARHNLERMAPNGFMSRQNVDLPSNPTNPSRRSLPSTQLTPNGHDDGKVHLSFNIPFSSTLAGPDPTEILHASPDALRRWTAPDGALEDASVYHLPVHTDNVESLRKLCRILGENSKGRMEATVKCSEPKNRRNQGLMTNVCISGETDTVYKLRAKILNDTPIILKCAVVHIDTNLILAQASNDIRPDVLQHIDLIAKFTGTDLFLINPKREELADQHFEEPDERTKDLSNRLSIVIYGDPESMEHAKTRVLILIDQILKRIVDMMRVEKSLHAIVCGRTRKNIRHIEARTDTAIYFPPPFSRILGFIPYGAHRRGDDEFFITGDTQEKINNAKRMLQEIVERTRCHVREIPVSFQKIDGILLDRLDKVRRIMEVNSTYISLPMLGTQRGLIRIQGTEHQHIERTAREMMLLAGQFYSASWWVVIPEGSNIGAPSATDIRAMLADISMNSGAEVGFERMTFSINGSDDAVKAALKVIQDIPFVNRCQSQIRVKIELANEQKDFVAGKKNGKINKIMGMSMVQIIFDGFNEYNFYIDVCGAQYSSIAHGIHLVELEMPAQIAFHVPDTYHKRIIGIGGQHIQKIMKKYSVFVKFSNAQDRGGIKDDDEFKVENVICRTPARNAQSLEMVKQDIMDMVDKADAEFVSETVVINRLYHRQLISRMSELEHLEKKWNCRIEIPSTEMASDVITISGPEFQVPQAIDQLLGMVPETHELILPASYKLRTYLKSHEFEQDVRQPVKDRYEVNLRVLESPEPHDAQDITQERLELKYTRNVEGALQDATEFLVTKLVSYDLDASKVKGAFPRPKSDSFEDSLPFFNTKLLQNSQPLNGTDSPTRSTFGDDRSDRGSFINKLRKQGSINSLSSIFGNCRVSSSSNSLFKQASSNASKASLISMESRESGYRNPWNDSGVILPDEDGPHHHHKSSWQHYSPIFPYGVNGTNGGDMTPKHDPRQSFDSGRPSTSHSLSGYPAPIGPPR